ncbi:7-deoxyloganetin glucosyltransferase [Quercus suber]|uniref:7-deoxyloganetin glucosyltransferase n=1 Tax=Quercus suber TaxID=58331 RepID=A0AAW0KRA9_QUESU
MGSIPEAIRPHVVCMPNPLQGHINPMLIKYNHKRLGQEAPTPLTARRTFTSKTFSMAYHHRTQMLAKTSHPFPFIRERKMGSIPEAIRPHVVCMPNPLQGHINPMLKVQPQTLRSRGPNSLDGSPDFHFENIPDGLPPSDADVSQDIPSLSVSISKNGLLPLCNLISKLNDTSSRDRLPVTSIISDGCMSFTLDAAEKFGIPNVLFWTPSSCGFLGYMHYRHLVERDVSHLTNGYLETKIDWIPGMKNICLKYLPSFIRTIDQDDVSLNYLICQIERASRALGIILNTFEQDALDALSSMLPRIYTIGPLVLLANQIKDENLKSIDSNLWKEQLGCVEWLNSKKPNSVVYVNFGSITIMTPQQLIEFAWGLANSEKSFLWIIRLDLVVGDSTILPPEFVIKMKDRAMLATWCAQEQILKHPSIGGFGKEMKKNVIELKTKAEEATKPGGSSYKNMEKLIAEVLQV